MPARTRDEAALALPFSSPWVSRATHRVLLSCQPSHLLWDNRFAHCEDESLPKVPSDWFKKELNSQLLGRREQVELGTSGKREERGESHTFALVCTRVGDSGTGRQTSGSIIS